MKSIKLLLIISALIGISNTSNAQAMVYDSTHYLTLYHHTSRDYKTFTTIITRQNADSIWFTSHVGQAYIAIGKKVYLQNSYLIFDYDKKEGDTIVYNSQLGKDTVHHTPYIIDSIRNKVLLNNKTYRHFYCHSEKEATGRRMIYIEGFGEAMTAWNPGDLFSVPEQHGVVAICIGHNELVKWDSVLIKLNDKPVDPTCNFDSFNNLNGIAVVKNKGINIYPNPAQDVVKLGLSNQPKEAKIWIYDISGKAVQFFTIQGEQALSINTSQWAIGTYIFMIQQYGEPIIREQVEIVR